MSNYFTLFPQSITQSPNFTYTAADNNTTRNRYINIYSCECAIHYHNMITFMHMHMYNNCICICLSMYVHAYMFLTLEFDLIQDIMSTYVQPFKHMEVHTYIDM